MTDITGSKIYTVNEICGDIKKYISRNANFENILVEGEVSNLSDAKNVHLYFSLRDKNTKAIMPVAIFGWKSKLGPSLPMKNGDSVIVHGSINIYPDRGQYQIIADRILSQGAGILNQKLEELKLKLGAEGLFDEDHKRPLPRYASRVGIVTSAAGAAIGDIRKIAKKRNPYVQLILYPSLVQGDGAAQNIAAGIRELQRHEVDVIIIGRGGGSSEDFSAFNEEIVARAVYECKVPVISAVGHDKDKSISDLTADKFAATPTEAADLAVFDVWDVMQTIDRLRDTAERRMNDCIKRAEDRSENYKLRLEAAGPARRLSEQREKVKDYERLLEKNSPAVLIQERVTKLKEIERRLAERNPDKRIRECRKRAENVGVRLSGRMDQIYNNMKNRAQLKSKDLEARSPLKKLESGYAFLAKTDGRRISRVEGLSEGDRIRAYMKDGSFAAVIDEVKTDAAVKGKIGTTEGE